MAGLDPATHVFDSSEEKDVDARIKSGHGEAMIWQFGVSSEGPGRYSSGTPARRRPAINVASASSRVFAEPKGWVALNRAMLE